MDIYTEVIKKLSNRGESTQSVDLKYNNVAYKEFKFLKKPFLKPNFEIKGLVYVSEHGEIVKDKKIQEILLKLSYYYEIFISESKKSLLKALESEGDINRAADEFSKAIKALGFLENEGVNGTEAIKPILDKVMKFREERNQMLNEFKDIVDGFKVNEEFFNENVFEELKKIYIRVLKNNFQSIKTISLGRSFYDDLIKKSAKKRKSYSVRFNKELNEPLLKLEYEISYFKRIIRTYENVINMNDIQYIKHIDKFNNDSIKSNLPLIRDGSQL